MSRVVDTVDIYDVSPLLINSCIIRVIFGSNINVFARETVNRVCIYTRQSKRNN